MKPDAALVQQRQATIRTYAAAWCEFDPAKRLELLHACFEETGTYSDPTVFLESRARLNAYLGDLHGRFARSRVVQASELETYRNVGRFDWHWALEDGTVRRRGVDFVTFAESGKLQSVVGFFNPL